MDNILLPFSEFKSEFLDKNVRLKKLLETPSRHRKKGLLIELNELLGDNTFLSRYKETGQLM